MPIGFSMFDCPEHTQTSPTRMLERVIVLAAVTVILNGPPADIFGSLTDHLPSAAAVAETEDLPSRTLTFSPAAAQPHTGIGWSR